MKRKLFFLIIFIACTVYPQGKEWIKENYSKKEYRIPMRDGVTLFTSVYTPKDTTKAYPIIMVRTPYTVSPYGEENFPNNLGPNDELVKEGNIFVFQDVRGQFMSEGVFNNMRPHIPNKISNEDVDESSDTYDTIEWLIKNIKHNNGNVGIWGISYPGFYAAMGLIDSHPALKAVSPQAPIADWFIGDDMHHNGAFSLLMSFNFFKSFDQPRDSLTTKWKSIDPYPSPDFYTFFMNLGPIKNVNEKYFHNRLPFWNLIIEHPNYDEFWQSRNILPHLKDVKPASLIVGGWYDSEDLYGPLKIYRSIEEKNPNNKNHLVMGPWWHGGWSRSPGTSYGDFTFPESTSKYYNKNILSPFFNYYLKGEGELKIPEAATYRTGENVWIEHEQWPPLNTINSELYLSHNGKLNWSIPQNKEVLYDEYLSDPNKPVPYTAKFHDSGRHYYRDYMSEDQRFAFTRPDILSYQTEPLEENITLTGSLLADLYVSTSGTDADWIVKIIDVFPDSAKNPEPNPNNIKFGGYQRLIRFEILRGKYRNSYETPEPFEPGKITNVKINLQDIDHTFLKGHKIMVQVQSSFFPFFDRNPQKFVDIYKATENDFQKAYHKIYYSMEYPSCVKFSIINKN